MKSQTYVLQMSLRTRGNHKIANINQNKRFAFRIVFVKLQKKNSYASSCEVFTEVCI